MPSRTGLSGGVSAPSYRGRRKRFKEGMQKARMAPGDSPGIGGNRAAIAAAKAAAMEHIGEPSSVSRAGVGKVSANGRGIGQAYQPGLGRQLSSRVSSDKISQEQAEKVASDRQALGLAFGPNWRKQLYGDVDIVQLRRQLQAEPDNPELRSQYEGLMAKRKRMIERAQAQPAR